MLQSTSTVTTKARRQPTLAQARFELAMEQLEAVQALNSDHYHDTFDRALSGAIENALRAWRAVR